MMKKLLLPLGLAAVLLAACRPDKNAVLYRKWQQVSLENPDEAAAIARQEAMLDTLTGKDTAALQALYGTTNLDSIRAQGRAAIAQKRAAQAQMVTGTWFRFSKDGTLERHSPEHSDEATFQLEGDRLLITATGGSTPHEWRVTHLSDTALHITASNNNMMYYVRFRPAKD